MDPQGHGAGWRRHAVTGSQSRAAALRDAVYQRVATLTGFTTIRRVPLPTLMATDLPALTVLVLSEPSRPDGDPNTGTIRFIKEPVIGISVTRAFDDPLYLQGACDADLDAIENLLFADAELTRLWPGALFEAITRLNRTWIFSESGEAYFAELRLELSFRYRTQYAPLIDAPLREIAVTVPGRDAPDIQTLYDLGR